MKELLDNDFVESLNDLLTDDAALLIEALDSEQPVAVRLNPFKVLQPPEGERVPWNRYGFYLQSRPQFTLDPEFHSGLYYVQEPSSMFVEHLYRQSVGERSAVRLLDMCAAPGGKATLYSTVVGLEGVVVANEVVRSRTAPLIDNVRRWGLGNVVVTNNDPEHFERLEGWFDVVAVDAPCSGEGMFRKSDEARLQWSRDNVKMCAARQRDILSSAWKALREGGVMIYSTCTFNREENEQNVEWLVEQYGCTGVEVDVPDDWGIVTTEAADVKCYRFFPHLVRGEGLFAMVVRKPITGAGRRRLHKPRREPFTAIARQSVVELSRWIAQPQLMHFADVAGKAYGCFAACWDDVRYLSEQMNVIYSGVAMGTLFAGRLRPDHALALFCDLNTEHCRRVEVDRDDALRLLRLEQPRDVSLFDEGINTVCYHSHPLAWVKRVGARVNNLMPKELRIHI